MEVSVSRPAKWWIKWRGGQIYVWGAPVGDSGSALIRTSTRSRPRYVDFERVDYDGLVLWFDAGLHIDDATIGWTPFTGIDVTWPYTIQSLGGS